MSRPRAIHHRPRPDRPTVAQLQDTWAELVSELGTASNPAEAAAIRQQIEQVEAEAAALIGAAAGR